MSVTIAAVNALPYAAEIKQLFRSHDRPEFPDFFDRTYPSAIGNGATSWIARDPAGRLAMHIACFPRRFSFQSRGVVAGLMVNLMVAAEHRTFFPAFTLIQRVVRDVKARGDIDLLYADPNAESRALLRGTRFVTLGTMQRYVLPVRHRQLVVDLALRSFHALIQVAAPRQVRIIPHDATGFRAQAFAAPHATSNRFVAHHDRELFVSRLAGYPGNRDWWITAHRDPGADPVGAMLIRAPDASALAVLHTVRLAPDLPLAAVLPGLVTELRRRECERIQVSTIAESDFGHSLRRCGFVPRSETLPLFAMPFTKRGEECVGSVKDWEITELECDR